jgi:GxxExxY protein
MELLYKELTQEIISACMEVHNIVGCGCLEAVYAEALEREFILRGIQYQREKELPVVYKGVELQKTYKVDFVCYGKIILELKASEAIQTIYVAQVVNYLKLSSLKLGIVINFGAERLEWKRVPNPY